MKFTKNGNSLLFPAVGYAESGQMYDIGYNGNYWSSSLYEDGPSEAQYFLFDPKYADVNDYDRYCGNSVRGVCNGAVQ